MPERLAPKLALVLLAAGTAQRFGSNKLAALIGDAPVLIHAARAFAGLDCPAGRFVVVGSQTPSLAALGFTPVKLPRGLPAALGHSLAFGIAAAAAAGADAALVALGDMPCLPPDHAARMLAAFDGDLLASRVGTIHQPPALIAARHFPVLMAGYEDRGAQALLRGAPALDLPANAALDIDWPSDLAKARAILGA